MYNIFLSAETQNKSGAIPGYLEEVITNKVVDVTQRELLRTGQFNVFRNDGSDRFKAIADSNRLVGKDGTHIGVHTNAGGGHGCEVFAFAPGTNSDRLSKILFNRISALTPMTDRAVKYSPRFDEVHMTLATASLIELAFHDNPTEAQWIVDNIEALGIELAKGICEFKGVTYVPAPVVVPVKDFRPMYEDAVNSLKASEQKVTELNNLLNKATDRLNRIKNIANEV